MFPVAREHCILATKFACSLFFNDVCIKKKIIKRKTQIPENRNYKMTFRPENALIMFML